MQQKTESEIRFMAERILRRDPSFFADLLTWSEEDFARVLETLQEESEHLGLGSL